MAKNDLPATIWQPLMGGLTSDVDIKNVPMGGLFTTVPESGALDVRAVGDGTGVSPDYENIKGDLFSNGFSQPVVQNRIFRANITYVALAAYQYKIYDANGTLLVTTAGAAAGANITATYNNIVADFLATVAPTISYTIGALTLTSATDGYFNIEITQIPYWDYGITGTINTLGTFPLEINIIQEAVDPSMLGYWNEIGDDDKIGDLFQLWTTRRTLPVVTPITGAVNNGAGLIRITAVGHGLSNNFAVNIQSVGGVPNATGIWIATVIDADTIDLPGSTFAGAYTGGGTLTSYIYGYGQITVSVKDENSQTWTGYVLLRSKEFNFSTLFQIDCRTKRKQDGNIALYFVDFNNVDRAFYYKQPYVNNGALSINGGIYEYGSIAEELRWSLTAAGFKVEYSTIIPSGGNVGAGNWYYYARFGTQNLSFTDWTLGSTRAVSVGSGENNGTPYNYFGDNAGTSTPIQVQLNVTIPIQNLFTYVEIAGINKLDGGFTGFIIGRYTLNGNASQVIIHTGFETGITNLDIGQLQQMLQNIEASRNVELINNRAVTSHLKFGATPDLSEWAQGLTYSIERKALPSTGSFINVDMRIGEFQDPDSIYYNAGYMLNERYRFSIRGRYRKTGALSPSYWARDIIINTDATQPGCTGAPPDYDLTITNTADPQPYTYYLNFDTPNLDFVVNGQRIRDLFSEIFYERCEVDNPQVLVSAVLVAGISNEVNQGGLDRIGWVDPNIPAVPGTAGEFPFVGGINIPAAVPVDYDYAGNPPAVANFTPRPKWGAIYAYDYFSGHRPATIQVGDIIRNFGAPDATIAAYPDIVNADYLMESSGNYNNAYVDVTVDEGYFINKGEAKVFTIPGGLYSKKLIWMTGAAPPFYYYDAPEGLVVYSAGQQFDALTAVTDRGFRNVQHLRLIIDGDTQYGAKVDSKYVFTGASFVVDGNEPANMDIFGGDVFTQKTWLKNRYPVVGSPSTDGMGQGFGFYTQNRANHQFRTGVNAAGFTAFPFCTPDPNTTVQAWLQEPVLECNVYNEGYTLTNQIVLNNAFDPLKEYIQDARNWIRYSSKESDGSFTDSLRIFPPLAIRVMDYTDGYITEFKNVNEKAIVIQQRKNTILNFNDAAMFSPRGGGEILTADSGVMDQKGIVFSRLGSSNKWSIQKGLNARGNDVLYGVNTDTDLNIWRYGYDGATNLSEEHLIASFCKNNFRYIIGKDNPAHEQGICSFSNQNKREVGWTFRGWKEGVQEWTEPVFHMEHQFDNTDGNGSYGDLIEVNGILYGTTAFSLAGGGIIFSFDPTTGTFTNLFDFTFGSVAEGYQPTAGLVYVNSKLYGVAQLGGANGFGTIYSINLNGTGFVNEFDMVLASGATGLGEMIEWNGKLYAMTSAGGTSTFGTLFEFDYNTSTYTELFEFTGTVGSFKGAAPQGKLYTDGTFLYGLTRTGGVNNTGVLFQYDLVTYTVLHEFATAITTGVNGGSNPIEGVTKVGSKLFGTCQFGGLANTGVLFEYDLLTLTYTNLHDFILASGAEPQCTPTQVGNKIFGSTRIGGAAGFGTIWSYDIVTNTYTKIQDLLAPDIFPRGQLLLLNNVLYGTSVGTTLVNYGSIFSYSLMGYYVVGDVVTYGTTSFEQIPAFYIALVDNVSSPPSPPDSEFWELVLTTDNRYYSFFTLIYSELKDKFQMFLTPKTKVYWQYKDGYGTCRPVGDTGTNFEEGKGNIAEWWNDGNTSLIGDPRFDGVINSPLEINKSFRATRYFSDTPPFRVEYTDPNGHISYLNQNELTIREGIDDAPIKRDSTVTAQNPSGLNNTRTSALYGQTLLVRTKLGITYNKVNSFIIKWAVRSRLWNK